MADDIDANPRSNVLLFDANGNPLSYFLDGAVRRMETQSLLTGKVAGAGANRQVTAMEDPGNPDHFRLQVEASLKPGSIVGVGTPASEQEIQFLTDDGTSSGSEDMVVDADPTPAEFFFPAQSGPGAEDIFLRELRFVFSSTNMVFDGDSFSKNGSSLSNGIAIQIVINNGDVIDLLTVVRNEDFLRFASSSGINLFSEFSGTSDVLTASFQFSGTEKLVVDSGDKISVTINDDFTNSGAFGVNYLTATFYGFRELVP